MVQRLYFLQKRSILATRFSNITTTNTTIYTSKHTHHFSNQRQPQDIQIILFTTPFLEQKQIPSYKLSMILDTSHIPIIQVTSICIYIYMCLFFVALQSFQSCFFHTTNLNLPQKRQSEHSETQTPCLLITNSRWTDFVCTYHTHDTPIPTEGEVALQVHLYAIS